MPMTIELQQQIDDLQIRLAHQEDLLESLNQIVVDQNQVIDRLSLQLRENQNKLANLSEAMEGLGKPVSEKPPHY